MGYVSPSRLVAALVCATLLPVPAMAKEPFWLRPFAAKPSNACPKGTAEHRIDWMAFVGADADPSGVPRRVEGRLPGVALGGDTITLQYGGLTRRFDFDSPRAEASGILPGGFFRIDYDLLQFQEFAEVDLHMPRPVDRFTLVLGSLGTSERADTGVQDAVWVEGITPDGRRVAPSYFYPDMRPADSNARIRDRAQRDGFGAPWMTGQAVSATQAIDEPIGAAFREAVVSVTLRVSGMPLPHGGGWAQGTAVNPPAQRVDVISGAYCG